MVLGLTGLEQAASLRSMETPTAAFYVSLCVFSSTSTSSMTCTALAITTSCPPSISLAAIASASRMRVAASCTNAITSLAIGSVTPLTTRSFSSVPESTTPDMF